MQLRFVNEPDDNQQKELQRMTQTETGYVAERARMILLSAREFSVPEITTIFEVTDETVYKWLGRFEAEGPEGLLDLPRSGRPRGIDDEAEKQLRQLLEESPSEEGYDFTTWTAPLLQAHLATHEGVEVSEDSVRRALHRMDFVWRRPRWHIDYEDPAYCQRMEAIGRAIYEAGEDAHILVQDETNVRRLPPLRSMWMPCAHQKRVPVPESNDKFSLYGVLDLSEGTTYVNDYPKGNSQHTIGFLEELLEHFSRPLILIWDQATWHTSKVVNRFIAGQQRLQVLLLPRRAPQENPMEDLWRHLKRIVAANLQRGLDTLKSACQTFFNRLSGRQALQMAGLPT
jgi:transposase